MIPYFNPKYLILTRVAYDPPNLVRFPCEPPYLILRLDVTPDLEPLATAKGWERTTAPLLFGPLSPGLCAFCGWVAERSTLGGPQIDERQRQTLDAVFVQIVEWRATDAIAGAEAGIERARGKKPADPKWLPEPDPIWLDGAWLADWQSEPWDGWAKWAERHRERREAALPPVKPVKGLMDRPTPEPKARAKGKRKATGSTLFGTA